MTFKYLNPSRRTVGLHDKTLITRHDRCQSGRAFLISGEYEPPTMAGIGEVSAIVSLAAAAAAVAKSVFEISARFKDAKDQYIAFAKELKILSQVLNQLEKFLSSISNLEPDAHALTEDIIDSCSVLLLQLESFRDKLLGSEATPTDDRFSFSVLKRTKWTLGSTELSLQRDRVDSMKTNILMMMTMMMLQLQTAKNSYAVHSQFFQSIPTDMRNLREQVVSTNAATATFEELARRNDKCLARMDQLESNLSVDATLVEETADQESILTTRTVDSIRSTTESILSIYAKMNTNLTLSSEEVSLDVASGYEQQGSALNLIGSFLDNRSVKHQPALYKYSSNNRSVSAGPNLDIFSQIVQSLQLFNEHVELVQDLWRVRERSEEFLDLVLVANMTCCSYQRMILEQSVSTDLAERLMNNYNDPYWLDPGLNDAISAVLQDKFTVYKSTQTQMHLVLEPVLSELNNNGIGQVRSKVISWLGLHRLLILNEVEAPSSTRCH